MQGSAARASPVYFLDRTATSSSKGSSIRLPFLNRRARKPPPALDAIEQAPPPPPKDAYTPSPSESPRSRVFSSPHRPHRSEDSDISVYLADYYADLGTVATHGHEWQPPVPPRSQTMGHRGPSVALYFPSPPPTPPKEELVRHGRPHATSITQSVSSPAERPRKKAPAAAMARSKSLPRISPEERLRQRAEERRRQEEEERELARLEEERQARIKAEKAAQQLEDEREEQERRRVLNAQLRAAAFQRAMRERQEAEEEALRRQALAERKRLARAKRQEESAQLERWRAELREKEAAVARRAEAERAAREAERAKRARKAGDWEGWLGVQPEGAMHWRRRYVQLRGRRLSIYSAKPSDGDLGKPISIVPITKAERVLEGPSAPEELEYIAHSLAIELHAVGDEVGTLLLYADNAEEKESLLVALRTRTDF